MIAFGIKKRSYQGVTECFICQKTLGQDSRDSGFIFCPEHMLCISCGERLSAAEARTSYDRFLQSIDTNEGETEESVSKDLVDRLHAKCLVLSRTQPREITQVELDFLNQLRLLNEMPEPNMSVSIVTNENGSDVYTRRCIATMTLDQMRMQLAMIEACAAAMKNAINQHAAYKKEDDAKFQKLRFTPGKEYKTPLHDSSKTSQRDSTTNVLPIKTTQSREEALKRFGQVWSVEDPIRLKKLFSAREAARKTFIEHLKMGEKEALEAANKAMLEGNKDLQKKSDLEEETN